MDALGQQTAVQAPPRLVAGTTPYAWPYDQALDPARVTMVVTLPGDADERGLALAEPGWAAAVRLAERVRSSGGVVITVITTPPRGGVPTPTIDPADLPLGAPVLVAAGIDGFYGTPLEAMLRGWRRDQVLIAGAWLETSVHSTMRSANDRGFECLLVLDACVPFDTELTASARSQVEMSGGIFGAVGETEAVLDALDASD